MTTPLGQGTSTWARTTQFADLEWGMPRKKVLAMFASARVYPRYEGRNPRTGEPVIVPETVALPSATTPVPDLHVYATITFDDDEKLDGITLKSEFPRPAKIAEPQLLAAANKVAAALGIDAVTALSEKPQKWKHKSTAISLECDDECFWFELAPA